MSILKKVFTSEMKGIDEKEMTMTAYISTGSRDRMNEVLSPDGVDMRHYRKNPVVLWAHDYTMPPIGKALWVKRDNTGIISKVKFASTAFAQEIFQLYKEGFLKAFSVGFVPHETEDGDGEKNPRRTYKKWELLEYSAVPVPANPEALSLAIQRGILKTDAIKEQIEKGLEPDDEDWDEDEEKESKEEAVEKEKVVVEDVKPIVNSGLDELLAENNLLKEAITAKDKEIADLRFRVFELMDKEQKPPEITAANFGDKVAEMVREEIRKAQGKIS